MTRDEVRRMLAAATGAAVPVCLATLDDPGSVLDAEDALDHFASTRTLETVYRRRAAHADAVGLPTMGFAETVERLAHTPHARLRLALVTGATGLPWCVLFVAPDAPELVAALAVLAAPAVGDG